MTVLVTGGAGFIGANLCKLLVERERSFIALDNYKSGDREYLHSMGVYPTYGDVRDPEIMDALVQRSYTVAHLAALPGIEQSIKEPWESFETNVIGSFRVLEAAARWGKHVIIASSNAVFGDGRPPYDENSPTAPVSPYGAGKLAIEHYARTTSLAHDFPVTILRFGNAYGPYSAHKMSVVARFVRDALAGRAFTIYGDGTQTRDFIYAGDIAEAIMRAVDDVITGTFQIGSGFGLNILAIAGCVNDAVYGTDAAPEWVYAAPRAGDVQRNYSDISRAKEILDWEPRTHLEEGMEKTREWFKRWMDA